MRQIEIRTRQDFEKNIRDALSKCEDQLLLFRGQVQDRPLVPSMLRGDSGTSRHASGCVPWLTAQWDVCARRLISNFRDSQPDFVETQAVMQHYGYRSFFVDVTAIPEVALWFALHEFRSEKAPFHINNELKSAVFQWARYLPSSTGFVYLIAMPRDRQVHYANLTELMPSNATRVHRQSSGAILCSPKVSPSIDKLVIEKLKIADDGWFRNSELDIRTDRLFPPPSIDAFYRCLCSVPYYVAPQVELNNIKMGHPLLGIFPIYAASEKELFMEYVHLTRILSQTHPALIWSVATAVVDFEKQRFKAIGACRVSVSRLMVDNFSRTIQNGSRIKVGSLPSCNLFLEFEPEASLIHPSTDALHDVIRGLWVILGKKAIRIAEIVDNFNDVFLGHECIYSIPESKLMKKNCACTDHAYDLKIVSAISQLLANGTFHLEKAQQGYLELRFKERNEKSGLPSFARVRNRHGKFSSTKVL
jgi:hypothetical protein